MAYQKNKLNRRQFIKSTAATAAALTTGLNALSGCGGSGKGGPKKAPKVIVIGVDGMDPRLAERLMAAGKMPHLAQLAQAGGYHPLGTSIPPQSPVAWACFINGAGPGSHGIFDFIHRDPHRQCLPFYSAAETTAAAGGWEIGSHKVPLTFWPFNHQQSQTVLRRAGTPFWDYLDEAGIESTFYDLPSNYPPSRSKHGHHRCLSGLGVTDLLGTYGTYQHFAEDGPVRPVEGGGYRHSWLFFENDSAPAELIGPTNDFLIEPKQTTINFQVHRDRASQAAAVDIQGKKILLRPGQWSGWIKLDYPLSMPAVMPDKHISGICRFFLQEVGPNFRLFVSPINIDPSAPAVRITEPEDFATDISDKLGLFYTTGFQEDHKALTTRMFNEDEFIEQAEYVLQERLNLLEYALQDYDEGLLFFYFSSTDLQAHMLWWDSDAAHPTRGSDAAQYCFNHVQDLYHRLDARIGEIIKQYGDEAAIFILSDHGFANFGRQFNLNTWLRDNGYLHPAHCTALLPTGAAGQVGPDWLGTRAYGLGINSLYLNLAGRERDGIVKPGQEKEDLLNELTAKLLAVRDADGRNVIRAVHRTDQVYSGDHTALAPDLVIGYRRHYRASWATCLGDITREVLLDNDSAWSADHCADVSEVPGILFCNRPIKHKSPALWDLAPTILAEYGLPPGGDMIGRNIFTT
ncbi:MAG: sulfatase arylsulfatase [Phycisphaerae bacterium SM23_30]|nr:MAG: sulfatase arylsulfatase [Phycisphaerae bacterium SM23_30]